MKENYYWGLKEYLKKQADISKVVKLRCSLFVLLRQKFACSFERANFYVMAISGLELGASNGSCVLDEVKKTVRWTVLREAREKQVRPPAPKIRLFF